MAKLLLGVDADDFREIKIELVQREKQLLKELDAFRDIARENERHTESLVELLEILDRVNTEDIWNETTDLERKWILDDFLKALVVHREYAEIQFYDVPTFKVDWSEVDGRRKLRTLMERETGSEPAPSLHPEASSHLQLVCCSGFRSPTVGTPSPPMALALRLAVTPRF
jgi:hypothetical protein